MPLNLNHARCALGILKISLPFSATSLHVSSAVKRGCPSSLAVKSMVAIIPPTLVPAATSKYSAIRASGLPLFSWRVLSKYSSIRPGMIPRIPPPSMQRMQTFPWYCCRSPSRLGSLCATELLESSTFSCFVIHPPPQCYWNPLTLFASCAWILPILTIPLVIASSVSGQPWNFRRALRCHTWHRSASELQTALLERNHDRSEQTLASLQPVYSIPMSGIEKLRDN